MYEEIFKNEMGQCKHVEANLQVKADAVPKFYQPTPIPLAMKEKVEEVCRRLNIINNLTTIKSHTFYSYTINEF